MKTFKCFVTVLLLVIFSFCTVTTTYATEMSADVEDDFSVMVAYVRDCDFVNLRELPSTKSDILEPISCSEQVMVVDQVGEWFKVEYDNQCGYVYWKYLKFEEEELSDTLIGSSVIHYKSSSNRDTNISIACSKIDDLVLEPGEQFKWSQIVGQASSKDGYLEAPIIVNRKYTLGTGGGVCQVSTTLYNALLDTDIVPDEVHSHSIGCAYAEHDATVAYGSKDFVFTNSYSYSIRVEAYSYKSIVVVNLYKAE